MLTADTWPYNNVDRQYHEVLRELVDLHDKREDRTGVGTFSKFGRQLRFDLTKSFPILTTKKVLFDKVASELCWFLKGGTTLDYLHEHNNHIWDEWADKEGNLGPVYGSQWRSWPSGSYDQSGNPETIDQITNVIESIRLYPTSRRHIVTAWNPAQIEDMALPPCHCFFQFYVRDGKYLDCQMYQRSADWFIGVPFNIASYALLTHIIAAFTFLEPGEFIHTFGDYHLYTNHVDQAKIQLSRTSMPDLPQLKMYGDLYQLPDVKYLEPEMFELVGYTPHPFIKAPIAV